MMFGALHLVLLGLAIICAESQNPPCPECESNTDVPPEADPFSQIRTHCTYPCECPPPGALQCPENVSVVRDGCGCCEVCARQRGEPCDGNALCDPRKGLVCEFPPEKPFGPGQCEVIKGLPCTVFNKTYDNGESFLLDCRTQCTCQNGTYACASLCPQESISPKGTCLHPRLVEVPGQCCREWMCDSSNIMRPPLPCTRRFTAWSSCSSPCGLGLSTRVAYNDTEIDSYLSSSESDCGASGGVEVRLCQEKACVPEDNSVLNPLMPQLTPIKARHHHVRKGHECKATQRPSGPVRLRVGPCRSRKRFRPRSCGNCPGACCRPVLTHTIRVLFACATRRGHPLPDSEGGGAGGSGEDQLQLGGWGGRWLPAPPPSLLAMSPPGTDLWERDPAKERKKSTRRGKYERQQMSSAQVQESWETPSLFHGGGGSEEGDGPPASSSDSGGRMRRKADGFGEVDGEGSEEGGELPAGASVHRGGRLRRRADWFGGVLGEEAGANILMIKPNLPKETRQPKRRRLDVRRGGRQNGGGRGKRSLPLLEWPLLPLQRSPRGVASHQFDWSHEAANEEELVTLSVQWIEKCQCSEIPCPETPAIELEGDGGVEWSAEVDEEEDDGEYMVSDARGEMILHRVHREMKP
ncbi:uncharacterized protein LOC124167274 [Ischnura elegans]|uniref:uncharacterized protein LOC124167274 n=1 Tax=Ischnura elegans TaxID=197161 RepID=UPI001ED89461|nr:uncharacterized protein LOC124167274 [Ischnura elegans]